MYYKTKRGLSLRLRNGYQRNSPVVQRRYWSYSVWYTISGSNWSLLNEFSSWEAAKAAAIRHAQYMRGAGWKKFNHMVEHRNKRYYV